MEGNHGPQRWEAQRVSTGHEDQNNLLDNMNLPARHRRGTITRRGGGHMQGSHRPRKHCKV
ncbi:hypothetical protein E2C01_055557 [Portunus trituberculatus]|uniref:Uncharacterized protein n=1 Tax=Portunus trituberculatus TaxID=210409 RepID=A0A5B7GVU3_PORTR|nr:hypothetical protein [Portunus trituberculatus]